MSTHKSRIRTIQALIAGSPCISGSPNRNAILAEFREVHAVRKIRQRSRRRLLEVLHSARGLDTTLKTFVTHHGCTSAPGQVPVAMGGYLYALKNHVVAGLGKISEHDRHHFQQVIVVKRNVMLHEAGAAPVSDHEVSVLLADMHSCIALVLAL